jgi:AcrR family transcriptional regulator
VGAIRSNAAAPKSTRRKPSQIRAVILSAARELFGARGYHNTTTRKIAVAAGVSERLIFFHFTSKALLFEEAVVTPFNTFMHEFIDDWRAYRETPHDLDYVARRWIGGMFDLLRDNRRLVFALLTATAYEEELADTLSDTHSPFAELLGLAEEIMAAEAKARGYTGLDIRLTVRVPFAALLAAAVFDGPVFAGMGRRPSRDRIVDEMTAMAVYGSSTRRRE